MKPRIIVCGLGDTGKKIFDLLRQQGAAVVGISDTCGTLRERPIAQQNNDDIIIGDLRDRSTLIKAGIKEADTLVLTSHDDGINLAVLTQARTINPKIKIINRLYNQTLGLRLDSTLPMHVSMSVGALAAPIFAFAALGNKAIGQLQLYNQTWPIHEELIDEDHLWLGKPLSELWENPNRMLIYYLPASKKIDLVSAVSQSKCLEVGDRLIIGTKPTFRAKRRSLQKWLKAIFNLRQYKEHGRPVLIVTLLLLITIFLATFTYIWVNLNTSLADALYFSVGMITGAGGKEEVAEQAPDSIKIFTAIMMIIGAGVIGICYALINDFILGSHFKQFWDAARVPSRNHYIVCGLGGIGMEIVRQLHKQGHEIVAIEYDHNNRFLHTARSLGVPVIIEDASLTATLQAANIKTAAALLAVTSNDMANVEIALTAKAVEPKLPVIVRSQDAEFAESAQKVFEFDTTLCPTELACPSFAAAALGGKILGNGITDHLLWVALATMITPAHPFCGKTVKEAAINADFVPLYLESNGHAIHSWQLLEISLNPGDVLYLTMPATRLDQLWRTNAEELETIRV